MVKKVSERKENIKIVRICCRIPEDTYYLLELAAKLQGRCIDQVLKWMIVNTFKAEDKVNKIFHATWHEDDIERLKKLADVRPDLLSFEEKKGY
jgi:hypothetical protein